MKAMIKNVRLSYVRVFEAAQINGVGDANYSVCLLIPKDSPEALKLMQEIDAVAQEMKTKYPKLKGQLPKMWSNPLRDGDAEKDGAEYQGMYFINAKRKEKQGAHQRSKTVHHRQRRNVQRLLWQRSCITLPL